MCICDFFFFFFQAEDGIRDFCLSRGLGDVYKRQVYEVIRIANKHPRVNILQPGPGVGGHCIPVDPWFLVGDYPETANFIRLALQTNFSMPEYVLHRAHEAMAEHGITDPSKVGIYGLTYKEDVDDCLLYTSPSPRDRQKSRMPSSA